MQVSLNKSLRPIIAASAIAFELAAHSLPAAEKPLNFGEERDSRQQTSYAVNLPVKVKSQAKEQLSRTLFDDFFGMRGKTGPEVLQDLFDLNQMRANQDPDNADRFGIVQGGTPIGLSCMAAIFGVNVTGKFVDTLSKDCAQNAWAYTESQQELVSVLAQALKAGIKNPLRFVVLTAISDGKNLNLSASKNIISGMLNPDYSKPLILYLMPAGGRDVFQKTLGKFLSEVDSKGYRVHYGDVGTVSELTEHLKIATNGAEIKPQFSVIAGHGSAYSIQFGESELIGKATEGETKIFLTRANVEAAVGSYLKGSNVFLFSCSTAGEVDQGENFAITFSRASEALSVTAFGVDNNCMLSLVPPAAKEFAWVQSNCVHLRLADNYSVRISGTFLDKSGLVKID